MSTHLVIDIIIYYFRNISDVSYISGINDTFLGVNLIITSLDLG
jgi:uncharacterized membrane protein (UPF0136 family)